MGGSCLFVVVVVLFVGGGGCGRFSSISVCICCPLFHSMTRICAFCVVVSPNQTKIDLVVAIAANLRGFVVCCCCCYF